MKKNIFSLLIFILPLFLVLVFPLFTLYISREFANVSDVINTQRNKKDVLFAFSYNGDADIPYKRALVATSKPTILVVGTSRTMQVRKEFFVDQEGFVNAAVPRGQLGNLTNIHYFTDDLPNNGSGTILFIGLDHNLFTEVHPLEDNINEKSAIRRVLTLPGINIRRIYLDYFVKKFSLSGLIKKSQSTDNVGFSAIFNNSGYRIDGSYKDGYSMKKVDRVQVVSGVIQGKISEIKRTDSSFVDTNSNVRKNLHDLDFFLSLCKERNINVIGFVPADPTLIHQEMIQGDSLYKKTDHKITQDLSLEFTKNGFIFFDLSDISKFGGRNSEFLDAIHGTDLLYAKAFMYMYNNDDSLKKVINKDYLNKSIKDSKGDFLSF